jgi:hypothetical protein
MLLEYFRRRVARPDTAGQLLLMEEPEAHLHPQLDWAQRDAECAARIPQILSNLKTLGTALSVVAIERQLQLRVGNMKAKLPRTIALINRCLGR